VCDADFERVKMLLQALGVQYIMATGEADALCAQMVLKRKAHACMSDDTDMFVHGCPRVLRHLNLMDETATLYDMSKILNLLGISMTEFRQICVVSGTDYNCTNAATAANDTPFICIETHIETVQTVQKNHPRSELNGRHCRHRLLHVVVSQLQHNESALEI
jgi:hypothetical protein